MKYWISKGRAEVKQVLRKCQKYHGGPSKMSSMSPCSNNKVVPFLSIDLDNFGPLYIKHENH